MCYVMAQKSDEVRKKTNVTPNEMPQICIFPKASPVEMMSDITTTACMAECSKNKL